MDRLRCIKVFIEVARGLSFSAAAQRLGMARGNVTKHVAWLEKTMEVQLLLRTTKSVSLTESGAILLKEGQELLERVETMEAAVQLTHKNPRGTLRVGAPHSFASFHLVPLLAAYTAEHPGVSIVMYLDEGDKDLVAAGLNMSIRIAATLKDSSNVAYELTTVPQLLVASPDYIAKRGQPKSVEDLVVHDCMVHSLKSPTSVWSFTNSDGTDISVQVKGGVRANFGEPLRHAALLDLGISMHPTYMVADDIKQGKLVTVLPDYTPQELMMYAVFPGRKSITPRVRSLFDFTKTWFSTDRWSV